MSQKSGMIWIVVLVLGLSIVLLGKYFPSITWLLLPLVLVLPIYSLISGDSGNDKSDKY